MYEVEVIRKSDNQHIIYSGWSYKDCIKGTDFETHPDDYIYCGDWHDDTEEREFWSTMSY